jgi:polysaccharide export outer membrane protein
VLLPAVAVAQSVVETPQQTNDRIRALSSHSPPHDYIIGNGDLVSIQVFDVPELTRDLRVSQTGTIALPLLPVRLHLSGLTEAQAELKIAEVLQSNGLVSHPQLSVTVKERKSKPITVVGAVARPMVYQADHQITLLEVLAEAGGVANDAGDTIIVTRRVPDPLAGSTEPASSGSENAPSDAVAPQGSSGAQAPPPIAPPALNNTITVNLNQLLESGDTTGNIVLEAGDVVTVPHAGIIYVLGAVGRPGGFVVSNDRAQLTALKVLSLAGGPTRTARLGRAVIVRRDAGGQQHEVAVDISKVMKFKAEDVQLRPSDILYIPSSTTKQAVLRATEMGLGIASAVALYRVAYY